MGQGAVDGEDTRQCLVAVASQCIGSANRDVHGFNVEDYTLHVVGLGNFLVVEPCCPRSGVVVEGTNVNSIHSGEELVGADKGCGSIFGVNVRSSGRVGCVFNEGVFLKADVVESNALEPVVDAVSPIIIGLEGEIHSHG